MAQEEEMRRWNDDPSATSIVTWEEAEQLLLEQGRSSLEQTVHGTGSASVTPRAGLRNRFGTWTAERVQRRERTSANAATSETARTTASATVSATASNSGVPRSETQNTNITEFPRRSPSE